MDVLECHVRTFARPHTLRATSHLHKLAVAVPQRTRIVNMCAWTAATTVTVNTRAGLLRKSHCHGYLMESREKVAFVNAKVTVNTFREKEI